jgi:hypothetical protein
MGHFDMTQWVDFARGLTPEPKRPALEAHLASCPECQTMVDFLRQITEIAGADPKVEVPAAVIRSAKFIFPATEVAAIPKLRRLAARLIFNPQAEPLPVGIRSEYRPVRQMVYEAGDYCVDLRVDSDRDSTHVTLVGQIANQSAPAKPLAGTPVILMSGKRMVCETVSNDFGEFCLEYTPKPNLRLCLPLESSGVQVEVALNRLLSQQ